jgi:nucleoside-diphosphate-sugar epimerase
MTKALVTGAAGFIGNHLVSRLVADGHEVLATDIKERPAAFAVLPRLEYVKEDLTALNALVARISDVDVVYHLASKHLEVGAPDEEFRRVNVTALGTFMEACAQAGVRSFVYVSSVGVYGHVSRPPATEDAEKHPVNIYERTKLEAESVASRLAKQARMKVIVVRPSWVFGTDCPRTQKLIRSLRKNRFFYIGTGANLRHPIYIDDALDGIIAAGRASDSLSGSIYNIAGPEWMPLREMVTRTAVAMGVNTPSMRVPRSLAIAILWAAEKTFALLGADSPVSRRSLAFFENDNAFDTTKAERELSFKPAVRFDEGIRKVLAESRPATGS